MHDDANVPHTPLTPLTQRVAARILLVDDHPVNQKVALRMIEKIVGPDSVEVHVANDGFEAVSVSLNPKHETLYLQTSTSPIAHEA